ncbi:MAG: prepilin-type N-terminal cleavage/methylation domain-containing protein [Candidatus Magasanikbacteria bacterium]|nr:prepilin-type N-terminal cleavage/methylation domain-containing protein [Candidatus Magasanikbacteria bacterium]
MPVLKNKLGFSLIEAIIATAIFALFVLGIYGGIQLVFKIVYSSRIRIIETALLNEQIEIIHNADFFDVGIVNGSPSGIFDRTVTTTRNGIEFEITRTIRNIDDPYDGTIDGEPQDTAPADYKLVDIEVVCMSCGQGTPLSVETYVAPKFLEGDPTHGALFVEVFDANVVPVQGATVYIVSTSTDPTYDFYDTTDNDGMLRIVDLAAGVESYHLTVTKDGYTTAQTITASVDNPNPTKPPATVVGQGVTEISFSIDLVSAIEVSSINSLCQIIPSVNFDMRGTKLLGTEPDVYTVDGNYATDGSGEYTFPSLIWDNYGFIVSGYDLIGTIPDVPLELNPGATQPVQLVVGANTINSLLIMVTNDRQPIANAVVHVSSTSGFDQSKLTGVGSITQTDWVGGAGQESYSEATRYFADSGSVDISSPAGDLKLQNLGVNYSTDGDLESSTIDLGASVEYVTLEWTPLSQSVEAGANALRFQIASSVSSSPTSWEFLGPDSTSSTYYMADSQVIASIHDGDRYMRYKVFLHTDDTSVTPALSEVSVIYTNSCTPPGQVYFGGLSAEDYTITVTQDGYQTYETTVNISGDVMVGVELTPV